MNIKHYALATLILTFSAGAFAAEWEKIGTTSDSKISINTAKIYSNKSNPKQKYVWSKSDTLKSHENFGIKLSKGSSSKVLYMYDCQNYRYKQMKAVVYNPAGDVIKSIETPLDWSEIVPDSTGDRIFEKVCQ